MNAAAEQAYLAYVRSRRPALRRRAALMCADWHGADDLVQTTLIRLYVHWPRVGDSPGREAWVRRVMLRAHLDDRRRPWRRHVFVERIPETAAAADAVGGGEQSQVLLAALRQVPPRQRAVLVLRFYEDLDVSETAAALDCSEGTVKSQTSRGLARLRRELEHLELDWEETR